jgi:hypothetical protein
MKNLPSGWIVENFNNNNNSKNKNERLNHLASLIGAGLVH